MPEATAVLQQRGGFFKKLGKIPGANILVPLLSACVINTFFPQAFALGSFTTAMTTNGSGALAVAFLLIVGTTISFKSAPQAAFRGTVIIVTKVVFCVALAMVVQFALGDNLLGLSSMVILAACSGANNSLYAGLMGDYGTEVERGAVAITTLVVGPPDTMIALGAAGQAPLGLEPSGSRATDHRGHHPWQRLPQPQEDPLGSAAWHHHDRLLRHGIDHDPGPDRRCRPARHPAGRHLLRGRRHHQRLRRPPHGGTGANVATPAAMATVNAEKFGGAVLAAASA